MAGDYDPIGAEEAARSFGNLSEKHPLPAELRGRYLLPGDVRATVASATLFDLDAMKVASAVVQRGDQANG